MGGGGQGGFEFLGPPLQNFTEALPRNFNIHLESSAQKLPRGSFFPPSPFMLLFCSTRTHQRCPMFCLVPTTKITASGTKTPPFDEWLVKTFLPVHSFYVCPSNLPARLSTHLSLVSCQCLLHTLLILYACFLSCVTSGSCLYPSPPLPYKCLATKTQALKVLPTIIKGKDPLWIWVP